MFRTLIFFVSFAIVITASSHIAMAEAKGAKSNTFIGDIYAHSPQYLNDGKTSNVFAQKHSIEFSYQGQTGDLTSVATEAATTSILYWNKAHNSLQLFGQYMEGKDGDGNSVVISRKRAALNFFRWHAEETWYLFGLTAWERNQPVGIDDIYTGCVGPGYYLLEQKKSVIRLEAGGCRTYEDRTDTSDDLPKTSTLLAIKVFYSIDKRIFAGMELENFTNIEDTSDSLTLLYTGLTGRITPSLSLSVKFMASYDTTPASTKQTSANTDLNISITYTFQ